MNKETLLRATHSGQIEIAGFKIDCYNLSNGERALSRIGFLKAIGRRGKAKGGRRYDSEFQTPVFLTASNIKGLITNDIIENSKPIMFSDLTGNESIGYRANLLPATAYLFAEALDRGLLKTNQKHIGEQSKILVKGFLNVSIISLVDEATGYQYDRERNELQSILKAYISEELMPWQKRFPDIFYREIFRLNGWDYTVRNIHNKPSVVGAWTNKLIYGQLPKGVLDELKRKTPKSLAGHYLARFHQSLTEDIGNPHLHAQLSSVIAVMQISDEWKQFISNFNKLVSRRTGQLELTFEDLEFKEGANKTSSPTSIDNHLRGLLNVPPENKDR
jgi:hypothetical protein